MLMQILNVLVLIAVLVTNGMAGAGTISGESIGLIANRYTSFFLPQDYVFGIWGLIYLTLVAFTAYQALPAQRGSPVMKRVGGWWAANGVLNIAWIVLFSFSLFAPALAVMVALLVSLVILHVRIAEDDAPLGAGGTVFVRWTFDLYLAWISVALIANTFQYMTYLGWSGGGISGESWAVIMMVVATALGAFMALRRGSWIFPLVVGWALWGIGARFPDVPLILWTARGLTVAGVTLVLLSSLTGRRHGSLIAEV